MKLNLNFQISNLSGNEIPGEQGHAGKSLAGALANANRGNSVKLISWSLKLWNNEEIEIDKSDKEFIEEFIETCETLTNLGKFHLLKSIKEQYEK